MSSSSPALPRLPIVPSRIARRGRRGIYWDRARCLGALHAFVTTHQRLPDWREWRRPKWYGLPARATLQKVFGSLEAALDAYAAASERLQPLDTEPPPE